MKTRTAFLAVALGALAVTPLGAYEGLQQDFATCLQGQGKASSQQIVAACTRMIDNAKAENELIGFAHAMRAAENDDKALNCKDAKKAAKLVKAPAVVDGAKKIIERDC